MELAVQPHSGLFSFFISTPSFTLGYSPISLSGLLRDWRFVYFQILAFIPFVFRNDHLISLSQKGIKGLNKEIG